ncbi:MAG: aminopeptidase [Bacteroidaceae bacterium]|nr:aminopeptidase [Bacteroidaceae bacterium]MBQ5817074.1 aminopeptidase [Bacteroidaceae bacterium]
MLKRYFMVMLLIVFAVTLNAKKNDITKMLKKIDAVSSFEKIEKLDTLRSYYSLKFTQQLDKDNPEAGTFEQRVLLGHRGWDRPMVIITQGYGGGGSFSSNRFYEELTTLIDANVLFVEHRYFDESTPSPCNWDYLTIPNSMEDYHAITTAFKEFYKNKWLSTGISKGGSTSMFYRAYYPDDVDVSVPYVAPLCVALEDGRHESFLEQASTKAARDAVRNFQLLLLERKEVYMPLFEDYCKKKNYTFRQPLSVIYDYCVLEYAFSFWQWGKPASEIPTLEKGDEVVFKYFIASCDPDYFSRGNKLDSFSVQAVKDFGYYGYNVEPFKKYIKEPLEDYYKKIMLSEEWYDVEFDGSVHRKVVDYLTENDPKMIYIYGEWDPWTANGVTWLRDRNKKNIRIFIEPDGSHKARIGTMPENMKKEILDLLEEWVGYRK